MSLCADLPLHQAVKAGDIQATEAVLKADAAVEDSPGKCTTMHAHDYNPISRDTILILTCLLVQKPQNS